MKIPDLEKAKPNQFWVWAGAAGFLLCLFLGLISFLGISGFGIHLEGETSHYAFAFLLIGILTSVFLMYYGTKLARNREIALEERRKSSRPKSEPTEGDQIFLDQFRAAGGKLSSRELEQFVTAHDKKKNAKEKEATIAHLRTELWITRGKLVEYGNTYYTREAFEDSNLTIIGNTK